MNHSGAQLLNSRDKRYVACLLAPAFVSLALFVILPTMAIIAYSFFTSMGGGRDQTGFSLANWSAVLTDSYYHQAMFQTFRVALITTVVCVILGYPTAYVIEATTFRHKWLLVFLLIAPFWISFVIRTFSWIHILGERGLVNSLLTGAHIISQPLPLLYNEPSVVLGLVHFVLPYMIINIYVSLRGIDPNLASAARTLGSSPAAAFRQITLPLSLPGVAAGSLLCFVLAAGSYATPTLLGGVRNFLFGNLIAEEIVQNSDWPLGATLSLTLLIALAIVALVYSRFVGMSNVYKGLTQ